MAAFNLSILTPITRDFILGLWVSLAGCLFCAVMYGWQRWKLWRNRAEASRFTRQDFSMAATILRVQEQKRRAGLL